MQPPTQMQALILAAGMGRRLGEFTADNTKCMLPVNGRRLIDRMLGQLSRLALSRIIVVVGYEGAKLRRHIEANHPDLDIVFIENPIYDKTNNIYSLWLARELMKEDETLLLESDLIFEDRVLELAINSPHPSVALVAKYQTWMDGTMVRIDDDNNIVNFIPKKAFSYADTAYYHKTVNIYRFSREFTTDHYLPFLEAYIRVLGQNEYYEQVLRVITLIDNSGIKALPIGDLHWYEIDDVQDLRIAETIFAEPAERLKKMQHSYGGYWRYPGLLDFCYLVNPYFPRPRMIDEMKANFETLLREYPSGMGVNSLLGSKYFGLSHDEVVVGNGAAELIKSLTGLLKGRFGVVCPTFEEYPNRMAPDMVVRFRPANADFSYTADDLAEWIDAERPDNLLLVNPDNPSGNFIDRNGLIRLAGRAAELGIRIIVDESFVDFADEPSSLLDSRLLRSFPTLGVMKSISKSYGVPGLRLGIFASADKELIRAMRRDVAIWNINSFAEFYMQIFNKYERDYERSCELFRNERRRFAAELSSISWLRVIPSQANYFLCELTGGHMTSEKLTLALLTDHNILIKDCSSKQGFSRDGRQYVRIAVRNRADNERLVNALKSL